MTVAFNAWSERHPLEGADREAAIARLSEHEADELHVFQSRRWRRFADGVIERGATRTRKPVFPVRLTRAEMLARLEKLGIPPWRITANGERLDERSDQYIAERLAISEEPSW